MSVASPGGTPSADFARAVAAQVVAEISRRGIVAPEYLDTQQTALYMGVSVEWLAKGRCEGFGPAYTKLSDSRGGKCLYKRSDVDAFMAARRVKGGGR